MKTSKESNTISYQQRHQTQMQPACNSLLILANNQAFNPHKRGISDLSTYSHGGI